MMKLSKPRYPILFPAIVLLIAFITMSVGCKKTHDPNQPEETHRTDQLTPEQDKLIHLNGTIQKLGVTTWMYGSHLIEASERGRWALTSDTVDLSRYEHSQVTLKGEEVEGYPVDGGPPYLRVTSIERIGGTNDE